MQTHTKVGMQVHIIIAIIQLIKAKSSGFTLEIKSSTPNNVFNEAIVRHNQLRSDLEIFSGVEK
jgi:uncharacterized membrane protein